SRPPLCQSRLGQSRGSRTDFDSPTQPCRIRDGDREIAELGMADNCCGESKLDFLAMISWPFLLLLKLTALLLLTVDQLIDCLRAFFIEQARIEPATLSNCVGKLNFESGNCTSRHELEPSHRKEAFSPTVIRAADGVKTS
uniref:Secreted protein n=1 Tax=Macrostomum lignano TaxID=282301 RepID=A0A1I8GE45_9PLAT